MKLQEVINLSVYFVAINMKLEKIDYLPVPFVVLDLHIQKDLYFQFLFNLKQTLKYKRNSNG